MYSVGEREISIMNDIVDRLMRIIENLYPAAEENYDRTKKSLSANGRRRFMVQLYEAREVLK